VGWASSRGVTGRLWRKRASGSERLDRLASSSKTSKTVIRVICKMSSSFGGRFSSFSLPLFFDTVV
jgi:hypothetical protein